MSNFALLLKIRLDEMFEVSATFRQNQNSKKIGMICHHMVMVILYGILFGMVYFLADYLREQKLTEALPVIGYFGAVVVTFVSTILKLSETFTGNEDSEFLLSMPFSAATQVFVMFVITYIRNLLCCVVIELPIYIVYLSEGSDTFPVGFWLLGLLLTSLPVCGIAFMVGMIILLCLVENPKKNQIMSGIAFFFLTIAVVLGIVMADRIYLVASGKVAYEGEVLATGLVKEISQNFKFGRFYQLGIVEGDSGYRFLFCFLSVIWYAILLFLHTMAYQSVITELRSPVTYGELSQDKVKARLKENDIFQVLLKKELEQFTRSENYLLQCAIGILLGIAIPLNFLVMGTMGLEKMKVMIPCLLCFFVGISNTTYCAMSMEGKKHWILEAAPIDVSLLKKAKLVLNMMITVPMILFGGIVFGIAFGTNAGTVTLYILIACAYAFINACWGNLIGTRYASYGFASESMIMHRGIPFLLGYLPGVLLPLVFIAI